MVIDQSIVIHSNNSKYNIYNKKVNLGRILSRTAQFYFELINLQEENNEGDFQVRVEIDDLFFDFLVCLGLEDDTAHALIKEFKTSSGDCYPLE